MARSALVFAVGALLVLGAAAGDSSSKNSGSSSKNSGSNKAASAAKDYATAKLKVSSPLCLATKDSFKSYSSCATLREEICLNVQSDSCDLCGFLTDDAGCDLQDAGDVDATVTAAVDAATLAIYNAVYGRQEPGGVLFTYDTVTPACNILSSVVPPGAAAPTCTITNGVAYVQANCAAGFAAAAVTCSGAGVLTPQVDAAPGAGLSAQCAYPTAVANAGLTYTCVPTTPPVPPPTAKVSANVAAGLKAITDKYQAKLKAVSGLRMAKP